MGHFSLSWWITFRLPCSATIAYLLLSDSCQFYLCTL